MTENEPIFSVSTSPNSIEIMKLILNNNTSICLCIRGGSGADSLGGAQQLTGGGGSSRKKFSVISRSRPDSVGGGL